MCVYVCMCVCVYIYIYIYTHICSTSCLSSWTRTYLYGPADQQQSGKDKYYGAQPLQRINAGGEVMIKIRYTLILV